MAHVRMSDKAGATIELTAVGDYILPRTYWSPEEITAIFESIPKFRCRENDIMICTYPKTGLSFICSVGHRFR